MPLIFPPPNAEEFVGKTTPFINQNGTFRIFSSQTDWAQVRAARSGMGTHTSLYPGFLNRTTSIITYYDRRDTKLRYAIPGWTKPGWYDVWMTYPSTGSAGYVDFDWFFSTEPFTNAWRSGAALEAEPVKTPVVNGRTTLRVDFPEQVLIEEANFTIQAHSGWILSAVAPGAPNGIYGNFGQDANSIQLNVTFQGYDDAGMSPLFMGYPL